MDTNIEEKIKETGYIEENSKIFHGWWIILVAAVGMMASYPPTVVYNFTVFLKALSQELQWGRSDLSFAYTLASIAAIICSPFVGLFIDRFGARIVVVVSMSILGLVMMSLYVLPVSLPIFYGVYLLLGAIGTGNTPVPFSSVISRWFEKRRGLALGLTMTGLGVGAFITPLLSQYLISRYGWQSAYLVIGFIVIAVACLVIGPFLKESPHQMGLLPDGEITSQHLSDANKSTRKMHLLGVSGSEAVRTGTFWIMVVSFLLVTISVLGCLIHLVPMLTDRGISVQTAAFATSVLSIATLLGRVGTGYLLDRFFAPHVALLLFTGAALGMFLLWIGVKGEMAFVAAFLIGFGFGAEADIVAFMVSRYFGLKSFGKIYGYIYTVFPLGGAIGPYLMGYGFDRTGSYKLILMIFMISTVVAGLLMTRFSSYPQWRQGE
jgi:MFS family permease